MIKAESHGSTQETLLNRRKALQLLGGGVASFLSGILVGSELKTQLAGYVATPVGNFYDVPERHDYRHIYQNTLQFPSSCQGYLAECTLSPEQFYSEDILTDVLLTFMEGMDTIPPSVTFIYTDEILSRLAAAGIPILVGDYDFTKMLRNANYNLPDKLLDFRVIAGGALTAILGIWVAHDVLHEKVSHRAKLKAALGSAALLLDKPVLEWLAGKHNWFLERYTNHDRRYRRAISRIEGLLSLLSPENVNTFFRNVYVAHKLLFYAKTVKNNDVHSNNFVYQYHGGHNSICDFLTIGIDACEELLMLFPIDFLKIVIAGCGGTHGFCSIRAVTLTPDFSVVRDPMCHTEPVILADGTRTADSRYYLDKIQGGISTDQIITNTDFEKKLLQKIQVEN